MKCTCWKCSHFDSEHRWCEKYLSVVLNTTQGKCEGFRKGKNMKTIVDENGEIVEVQDENEIAEQKLMEVGAIDKNTYDFLEEYLTAQERYETFKFVLEKAMRENGIKSWKNDYFTATVKDDSVQMRVDTAKLKESGLYEQYSKMVPVKGGLQIRFKDQRKD